MLKPKQHNFADDELRIYDDAIVYKRGDYFQMRMWLHNEKRYARFSLRTVNVATAVDRAKVHYHQLIYLVKPTSPKQLKRALKII